MILRDSDTIVEGSKRCVDVRYGENAGSDKQCDHGIDAIASNSVNVWWTIPVHWSSQLAQLSQ